MKTDADRLDVKTEPPAPWLTVWLVQLENRHQEVSRVTVRAKEAVEAAGGTVRRVYYNKLGLRALLKPEWFEKKGRLLPRAARPPPKQQDKVDSIGRLPAPTKPIPFSVEYEDGGKAASNLST
ncbi:50S ribosomal protein L15 [Cucumis melo var. makuwa]|uniref:50S ribosomal protein L15 n=1 Tax=Cucumis melo var. makuwa TaxID=1194695 RepID=A0A5A7UKZ6_CUCMM|nr:50S ribosomal protein L15 [Cucumis melo var. makuwa]TYK15053.1 50S ribosomal protein L15 [Cucumis melo var. makuwa]